MSGQDWMREYGDMLYLRALDEVGLWRRFDDIAKNLWSTGQNGEVTPPRSPENRQRLLRLFVHHVAEQMRRGKAWSAISEAEIRLEASKHYSPPRLKEAFTGEPACFAKFGELVYLRGAFERGALRIKLASKYADAFLNPAQRDDELMRWSRTPNRQLMMGLIGLDEDGNEVELPYRPLEYLEGRRTTDFYVWCCSAAYDARLFSDFGYDAVLIIRDEEAFRTRLRDAMKRYLPGSRMVDGRVEYYDPYDIDPKLLRPIFMKEFRYLYQNEHRFAWEIEGGVHPEFLDVEIGPLTDIAELLELLN